MQWQLGTVLCSKLITSGFSQYVVSLLFLKPVVSIYSLYAATTMVCAS